MFWLIGTSSASNLVQYEERILSSKFAQITKLKLFKTVHTLINVITCEFAV